MIGYPYGLLEHPSADDDFHGNHPKPLCRCAVAEVLYGQPVQGVRRCERFVAHWHLGVPPGSQILEMDNLSRMSHLHCIDNPLSYGFVQLPTMLVWISIFGNDHNPYIMCWYVLTMIIWTGNMSSSGRIGIVSGQSHVFTTYSAFSTCSCSPSFF